MRTPRVGASACADGRWLRRTASEEATLSLRRPIPRLVPQVPFPTYSYVPRSGFPHPTTDPGGHSFGREPSTPPAIEPEGWRGHQTYLRGFDLFNHLFFWEAHESWESLWHVHGRRGEVADFLKGLIKLAAAGVKQREGVPAGVRTHASRAAELWRRWGGFVGRIGSFSGSGGMTCSFWPTRSPGTAGRTSRSSFCRRTEKRRRDRVSGGSETHPTRCCE